MQKNIEFSIEKIIKSAWRRFNDNRIFWIGVALLSLSMSIPGNIFPALGILFTLVSCYISASVIRISINFMQGHLVNYNDFFQIDIMHFFNYLAALILCSVSILLGFLFFVIPGIYLMTRLIFVQYFVIDKKISFDAAIKRSWKITKGNEINILAFLFAMLIIFVLGFLAFVVGVVVAIPITQLSTAKLYLTFLNGENISNLKEDLSINVNYE
tara:strand:+ start:1468 stop:2106 length:639 start_codon:yes stop_codon:yes gene_type:complete